MDNIEVGPILTTPGGGLTMALTTLETTTVNRTAAVSRKLLEEVKPVLDMLDVIYNAVGGVGDTIPDPSPDLEAAFSGLTKTQLDDALFVLTGAVKTAITDGYAALAQLAARV